MQLYNFFNALLSHMRDTNGRPSSERTSRTASIHTVYLLVRNDKLTMESYKKLHLDRLWSKYSPRSQTRAEVWTRRLPRSPRVALT
ncbi:Serine/threonine-protein phosphatase [Operophtera brumata]|uniref:Serine/threonine-protein phosphatase n=1 Tax=Operophtera brumata TaxID=104452 RepID=A0A0L7L444_OPEBR|nr:Serine/threonine-protein phosphatase [Operophtera brumata]